MTGAIRLIVGLLIVFGAVGTLDMDPNADLLKQVGLSLAGLALMAWAVIDMNKGIK